MRAGFGLPCAGSNDNTAATVLGGGGGVYQRVVLPDELFSAMPKKASFKKGLNV